jgi:hypothetical protein
VSRIASSAASRRGLGYHGNVAGFFQKLADALADDGVIVGQHDSDGFTHGAAPVLH